MSRGVQGLDTLHWPGSRKAERRGIEPWGPGVSCSSKGKIVGSAKVKYRMSGGHPQKAEAEAVVAKAGRGA
jgi:hypothetical protein